MFSMSKTVNCTEDIVFVSHGDDDMGKLAALAANGKFHASVLPDDAMNQNAFSNVVVNGTTITADSQTDTLELAAGTNIELIADEANEKVTIAVSGKVASAVQADSATTAESCTGNAATATKMETARSINGVAFDGSADITITVEANGGNADTVDGKHAADFAAAGYIPTNATETTDGSMSATDKVKLDGVEVGAQVNQNAFANVAVNGTTIEADSQSDTLEFVAGTNIELTADATNEQVSIAVTGKVASAVQADSAIKLATVHTINGVAFDGTADITITQVDGKTIATTEQIPTSLAASSITNTPSGDISSTDVQAALDELDSEKLALTGGTISGNLEVSGTLTKDGVSVATIDNVNTYNASQPAYTWYPTIQCATWSRICSMSNNSVMGNTMLLRIAGTRGNVVFNHTFLITANHNNKGNIMQLSSGNYSEFAIRLIVDFAGACYVEIYDTAYSATSATTQTLYCHAKMLSTTGITPYTAFTDGTTLPDSYVVAATLTTKSASIVSSGSIYAGSKQVATTDQITAAPFNIAFSTDNAYSFGTASYRASAIYAATSTIATSDERAKTDITDSGLGLDFINALRPVSYKFKVGSNSVTTAEDGMETVTPVAGKRTHYGMIAQEVKVALGDIDFGGYIYDSDSDTYGLRYEEFVSPLIKAVKELSATVTAQVTTISTQAETITAMETRLTALEAKVNA